MKLSERIRTWDWANKSLDFDDWADEVALLEDVVEAAKCLWHKESYSVSTALLLKARRNLIKALAKLEEK